MKDQRKNMHAATDKIKTALKKQTTMFLDVESEHTEGYDIVRSVTTDGRKVKVETSGEVFFLELDSYFFYQNFAYDQQSSNELVSELLNTIIAYARKEYREFEYKSPRGIVITRELVFNAPDTIGSIRGNVSTLAKIKLMFAKRKAVT